jgi:hypothetical protein
MEDTLLDGDHWLGDIVIILVNASSTVVQKRS